MNVTFTLNGKPARVAVDGDRMLLWVLRNDLGLTGTKFGCGEALCGACTVLLDGRAVNACLVPFGQVRGAKVVTIEGLARVAETDMYLRPDLTTFTETLDPALKRSVQMLSDDTRNRLLVWNDPPGRLSRGSTGISTSASRITTVCRVDCR